jgi:hypothetical protein
MSVPQRLWRKVPTLQRHGETKIPTARRNEEKGWNVENDGRGTRGSNLRKHKIQTISQRRGNQSVRSTKRETANQKSPNPRNKTYSTLPPCTMPSCLPLPFLFNGILIYLCFLLLSHLLHPHCWNYRHERAHPAFQKTFACQNV